MNEDKEKKIYELALLLKEESVAPKIVELVRQHSGELLSEPRMKKIALAYPIKKNTEAIFTNFNFQGIPEDAKALEEDLNTRQEVIRFMVLIAMPPSERPVGMPPFPSSKRGRFSPSRSTVAAPDAKPAPARPLSNQALEKKIEEILG